LHQGKAVTPLVGENATACDLYNTPAFLIAEDKLLGSFKAQADMGESEMMVIQ